MRSRKKAKLVKSKVWLDYDMTSFNRIELAHKLTHKQQNVIYFYREYIKYSHLEFHFRWRCGCCCCCCRRVCVQLFHFMKFYA